MNKSFLFLIGLAVVLGVVLGGAFIGGMAFGKSQTDTTANVQSVAAFGPGGPDGGGFAGRNQPGGFQQRSTTPGLNAQTGIGAGPAPLAQRGPRGGGDGAVERSGLMGTVTSVEGTTFTIDTSQGPVQVKLAENTTIVRVVEVSVEAIAEELQVGAQVRVVGEEAEGEEGVAATSVIIIPEGAEGLLGRGFSGERNFPPDRPGQ